MVDQALGPSPYDRQPQTLWALLLYTWSKISRVDQEMGCRRLARQKLRQRDQVLWTRQTSRVDVDGWQLGARFQACRVGSKDVSQFRVLELESAICSLGHEEPRQHGCSCAINGVLVANIVDTSVDLLGGDAVERLHGPPCSFAFLFPAVSAVCLPRGRTGP